MCVNGIGKSKWNGGKGIHWRDYDNYKTSQVALNTKSELQNEVSRIKNKGKGESFYSSKAVQNVLDSLNIAPNTPFPMSTLLSQLTWDGLLGMQLYALLVEDADDWKSWPHPNRTGHFYQLI